MVDKQNLNPGVFPRLSLVFSYAGLAHIHTSPRHNFWSGIIFDPNAHQGTGPEKGPGGDIRLYRLNHDQHEQHRYGKRDQTWKSGWHLIHMLETVPGICFCHAAYDDGLLGSCSCSRFTSRVLSNKTLQHFGIVLFQGYVCVLSKKDIGRNTPQDTWCKLCVLFQSH